MIPASYIGGYSDLLQGLVRARKFGGFERSSAGYGRWESCYNPPSFSLGLADTG